MKYLILTISILTLFSCNSETATTTDDVAADEVTEGISLNNGEKWEVNAEMKPHIEKGEAVLKAFITEESEDYPQLAAELQEQNNALIKSCTMKGKSHDELHKWLYPHIQLINQLSKAENYTQAKETINALEKSFKLYHQYFK